jgi:hypothetical protein
LCSLYKNSIFFLSFYLSSSSSSSCLLLITYGPVARQESRNKQRDSDRSLVTASKHVNSIRVGNHQ